MFDTLDIKFTHETGKINNKNVTVIALSTCGFCRRGLAFLRENNVDFSYVYVDLLTYDTKEKLKNELQTKFDKRVAFPFLIINDEISVVGFVEQEWKSLLL